MTAKNRLLLYAAILALAALIKTTAPVLVAEDPIPQCTEYPNCPNTATN